MNYYIAVINPDLHLKEWGTLKATLKSAEVCFMVYYSDVREIELNEVCAQVFYDMVYCEN